MNKKAKRIKNQNEHIMSSDLYPQSKPINEEEELTHKLQSSMFLHQVPREVLHSLMS